MAVELNPPWLNRYREKASKDANEVLDKVCQISKQSGKQGLNITAEEVRLFCKESQNLRLLRGYPVYEELESTPNSILTELGINKRYSTVVIDECE